MHNVVICLGSFTGLLQCGADLWLSQRHDNHQILQVAA
jgi:hypothetical protein